MPNRERLLRKRRVTAGCLGPFARLPVLGVVVLIAVACGEESKDEGSGAGGTGANSGDASGGASSGGAAHSTGAGGDAGGVDGGGAAVGSGIGGGGFNQCGVAAPLPENTGQCSVVAVPAIANFDDFAGDDAANYTYQINAGTTAAVTGAILHVGDGSDENGGTGVITTEMVPGEADTDYALQFADTNAMNWGGLLMLYLPGAATTLTCLDAQGYSGIKFAIKGSSPSGNFGVNLSMLDTVPTSDDGLCDNASASDCRDAAIELSLPADADTWMQVELPWSALTPGVGSDLSCVPVTGQNLVRLVIQPLMSYPAPDYSYEAGAYSLTVDSVTFY